MSHKSNVCLKFTPGLRRAFCIRTTGLRSSSHLLLHHFLHNLTLEIGNEVLDRHDEQAVAFGEDFELGQAGHGAVIVGDFADGAGREFPGKTAEVYGCFRVAGAAENAFRISAEREDMAGTGEIFRA